MRAIPLPLVSAAPLSMSLVCKGSGATLRPFPLSANPCQTAAGSFGAPPSSSLSKAATPLLSYPSCIISVPSSHAGSSPQLSLLPYPSCIISAPSSYAGSSSQLSLLPYLSRTISVPSSYAAFSP